MKIDMIDRDEVLRIVQRDGPVLPLQIRAALNKGDSITIGAQLATLTSAGVVKTTNVKKGGSPFYYVDGQEAKLAALSQYLNEKDRRTFEALRQNNVLRDSAEEPLTRVSLRNIPDFSRKLIIRIAGQEEIYWRYYQVNEQEAVALIKQKYLVKKEEPKPVEEKKAEPTPAVPTSAPVPAEQPKPRKGKEKQSTLALEEQKQPEAKPIPPAQDDFLDRLKRFFAEKDITIIESELVRKNSEYDFTIQMHTPVGKTEYYCKAKNKKKCSEGDLSQAYVKGQMKRLPVLFLTAGDVTKKAAEKTKTDYKGMLIARLE